MKNRKLLIAIICLTILISLFYKRVTVDKQKSENVQEKIQEQEDFIIRQKNEISSLRTDIRYYVDREKSLKEEIEVLSVTVDSLRSENYNLKIKSKTHEKNPIISDSKSAYYTKFLSNRYSK